MSMRSAFVLLSLALFPLVTTAQETNGSYDADWSSLARHDAAPEWFRDAKFGIYFHWGVYSVPAFSSEWYPRHMHQEGHRAYEHHLQTYGDPSEFGYHDFVPLFRAEHFDAAEWAELFARAGARFAGPVAEHHDGFAMWDSELTPWNAADRGPKRDITGELAQAIRARGMKLVTTFHHARNQGHYHRREGWPTTSDDPELRILYANMPREEFLAMWLGKLVEVIDKYQPDLMWFDSWLHEIPDAQKTAYLAHYFNRAEEWNRDVVVTFKQDDLSLEIGVEDFEKGRADKLKPNAWLTDDTISLGSWCYTQDLKIKPFRRVLHDFLDIVSKNGQLLLNISPKADGTIPAEQRAILLAMGDWLGVAGEAIYDTRPWRVFGEGPTRLTRGGHFVGELKYGAEDLRYTRSKDGKTLYVLMLGWPEDGVLAPQSIAVNEAVAGGPARRVELLGHANALSFEVTGDRKLRVALPALAPGKRPTQEAWAIALRNFDADLHFDASFFSGKPIRLTPGNATLDGDGLRVEEREGRTNIGFWDDASESAHWLLRVDEPGTYTFRGRFNAAAGKSAVRLRTTGHGTGIAEADIPATKDWHGEPIWVDLGTLEFPTPGVHHLILEPADPAKWNAVNLYEILVARGE